MTAQDSLFLSTGQPQKKLEIAIVRLLEENEDPGGRYSTYLKKRLRPALLWIIGHGSPQMLGRLLDLFHPDSALLLEAATLAGRLGKTELTAALVLRSPKQSSHHDSPKTVSGSKTPILSGGEKAAAVQVPEGRVRPERIQLCEKILRLESDKLYSSRPFFGSAAARLTFCPIQQEEVGTDGTYLYYSPGLLIRCYQEGLLEELLLHMVLHCLFLHFLPPCGTDEALWNRRCDAFVLRELEHMGFPPVRSSGLPPLDSHRFWFERHAPVQSDHSGGDGSGPEEKAAESKKLWTLLRSQMPESKKTGRPAGNRGVLGGSRLEWAILRENGRYDFRRYLRRFTVISEEMQIDPDSIDPIPYYYGQTHFGNMPLIEPLETGEFAKIQELVIAIDTSGSCSRSMVQRFLEETCSILTSQEYFFCNMRVHLIQCDAVIEDHQIITSREEWRSRSSQIQIRGRGGTDFTPVFSYVEKLRKNGQIGRLKGLLYFTDGDGIYPQTRTDYETAFVFSDRRFLNFKVPGWITPLCLDLSEEPERE